MGLDDAEPQKTRQQVLPLEGRGEASEVHRSAEASSATNGNARPGASGLMELVCERQNLKAALKRVRQNKGSPGIDGMTVEELEAHLRVHWPAIREALLAGRYQPQRVKRVVIPKPGGGERELGHAFVRYADDLNVYVRSKRAGERVMRAMRRLYARLRLRVNETKSAVGRATERKFLGFSFWIAPGREVKRRVAPQALERMKDRVRELTRRVVGRSLAQTCERLREYLNGWKGYFHVAQTPRALAQLDEWIRHRLRALQLKHWKRGPTI
ncbi:group II intron maturase-specific domain-containing protein [Sandaracinus amylolyticus]|uniref:group II intron maturase-specific domain-containing protein n=1 Tax=Sandaracinus amylolyticus TaxID=927083 RepID=UPI001EFF0F94|nr:group II intron maturase-specific domain-containing protein [Sandaracinus amylolyticus]